MELINLSNLRTTELNDLLGVGLEVDPKQLYLDGQSCIEVDWYVDDIPTLT